MSRFHSTLSRRDFMKGLGLAGAGLGAAAAAAPVFHDLDELGGSQKGVQPKHPWFVKEREYMNPTTEIHWEDMERFEAHNLMYQSLHSTPENVQRVRDMGTEHTMNGLQQNLPGLDLRAMSLKTSSWLKPYLASAKQGRASAGFIGQRPKTLPHERYGIPRWTGTPEENARMIRSVGRHSGATHVAFGEVIEGKTKKLINATTSDFGSRYPVVFEDVDVPYVVDPDGSTPGKMVYPNKLTSAIILTIRQDLDLIRMAPSYMENAGGGKGYDQIDITQYRMKSFLNGIGYEGVGGTVMGLTCSRPGWGALFGLGELSRTQMLLTPEYGPLIRTTMVVFTDLPLATTNPIDAGQNRFCYNCFKCADSCPVSAIYKEKEPDFIRTPVTSTEGPIPPDHLHPEYFNNSPGYKRWPLNHYACNTYWGTIGPYCGICHGECVFSKHPLSSIHEFVKPIIAYTTALNGFFLAMDKAYGYGGIPEEEWNDWWEEEFYSTPGYENLGH